MSSTVGDGRQGPRQRSPLDLRIEMLETRVAVGGRSANRAAEELKRLYREREEHQDGIPTTP